MPVMTKHLGRMIQVCTEAEASSLDGWERWEDLNEASKARFRRVYTSGPVREAIDDIEHPIIKVEPEPPPPEPEPEPEPLTAESEPKTKRKKRSKK